MSQYLFVFVTLYPYEGVLDKNMPHVEAFIKQSVADANKECRSNGRKSFLVWQKLAPESAQNMFATLDYQIQKAIVEEQDTFGSGDGGLDDPVHVTQPKHSSYPSSGASKKNNSINPGSTNATSQLASSQSSH